MPNLLATQSHVVHGYVGNKAATFPLQCLNWNVDALNVVQFSNHTGYGFFIGSTIDQQDLEKILAQVLFHTPNLVYSALLTGYLPNKECVSTVLQQYNEYKTSRKDKETCLWLLDPVMGDEYQLYVNSNVIPEYKKFLSHQNIDIITPNSFEMQLLYHDDLQFIDEKPVLTMPIVFQILAKLHENVKFIVVTSLENTDLFGKEDSAKYIYCLASWHESVDCKYLFRIPKIDSYFTGVGDLFSSILLHSVYNSKLFSTTEDLEETIVHCINYTLTILQQVLHKTVESRPEGASATIGGDPCVMKAMELQIVNSKQIFLGPTHVVDFLYKKISL